MPDRGSGRPWSVHALRQVDALYENRQSLVKALFKAHQEDGRPSSESPSEQCTEAEGHNWARRRDGRQCANCGTLQFGVFE